MIQGLLNKIPQTKGMLLQQVRSGDNVTALEALKKLQAKGWTQDDTFHNLDLRQANLQNARLARSSLTGVILHAADLRSAYFGAAKMTGADLRECRLSGANLCDAALDGAQLGGADLRETHMAAVHLRGADLQQADLQAANLWRADLCGANLRDARLRDANLAHARFDGDTILPDGRAWTPDTDMDRFTNPDHPSFWQPTG